MKKLARINTLFFFVSLGISATAQSALPAECTVMMQDRPVPSVLHAAAGYGKLDTEKVIIIKELDQLLAIKCPTDASMWNGEPAINYAVVVSESELMRYLLKAGANPLLPTEIKRYFSGMNRLEIARNVHRRISSDEGKLVLEILEQAIANR